MSDAYRAFYDAANLQLGGLSYLHHYIQQEVYAVSHSMQAPHVLMRPSIILDGTMWCALYGEDLMNGVAGFGETPEKAMAAFDKAWFESQTPAAVRQQAEQVSQ